MPQGEEKPPLCKGGKTAEGGQGGLTALTNLRPIARCGSTAWVQRHAGPVSGRPYCAAALSNRTRAGCVQPGKEASLVQREVAANAAGGIDEVPPLATCAAALSNQTGAEPFNGPYNPPCMAAPCCPPFTQRGLFFALRDTTDQGKESMGAGSPSAPSGHDQRPML